MKKNQPLYNCSQENLYSAGRLAWAFCLEFLTTFTLFKGRYTQAYIDAALQEIADAEKLGDLQQRLLKRESELITLGNIADTCLDNWQALKCYILDAFTEEFQKPNLEAAGSLYYEKAASGNWSALRSIASAGSLFISENLALLQQNDNMPAAFAAKFTADTNSCITISQNYSAADVKKLMGTSKKNDANNAVYKKLTSMLRDGQRIFYKDEAKKSQFVLSNLLEYVGRGGVAAIKGYITNSATEQPLAGVAVSAAYGKYSAITNADGYYEIRQLAADTYKFTFEKEGYQSVTKDIEIKTATASSVNIPLQSNESMLKVA